jgi:hypothetical protein
MDESKSKVQRYRKGWPKWGKSKTTGIERDFSW